MSDTSFSTIPFSLRNAITLVTTFLIVIILTSLSGCKTTTLSKKEANQLMSGLSATAPGSADDLMIVDCLLPGKIRRLGSAITYLTPRRAIKTTTLDCRIRGGEYVAHDRSNYETALKVWLSKANEGDKVAQIYVGEIYEKGLGREPDYALAADWYRKAAEQGYERAQINLGHLYEKGLGVEKNLEIALNWYRKASGLKDAITFDPGSIDAEANKRVEELSREVERRKSESESLRKQLEQTRQELEETQRELKHKKGNAKTERLKLETERQGLERQKEQASGAYKSFEDQLEQREAELEYQRQEISGLNQEITQLDTKANNLKQTRRQLEKTQRELKHKEGDAETERLKLETERHGLERQKKLASGDYTKLKSLEEQLEQRESDLENQRQEITALHKEIAQSNVKSKNLEGTRLELEQTQQALEKRKDELEIKRQELANAQQELEKQKKQSLAEYAKTESLEEQLKQREALLEDKDQEIIRMSKKIDQLDDQTEHYNMQLEDLKKQQLTLPGPSIVMINPPLVATRGIRIVKVNSEFETERVIEGKVIAPAGLLTFTVNDRNEKVDENGIFRIPIHVMHSNVPVKLIAIDNQEKRATVEFQLTPEELKTLKKKKTLLSSKFFGNYYALIIGNEEYIHWPPLGTPENDAVKIAELLGTKYGFKTKVLINATQYEILQALNELRMELKENDNLLIYYAGHGHLEEKISRGYWIPIDGEMNSNTRWISTIQIADILSIMSVKHVLIVADSCYSGALTRSSLARLEAGMTDEARRHWIKVMTGKRSRTALTSGDLQPVIDRGGGEHSVFAKALINVLIENDDILEGQSLYKEISARVAYAASAVEVEQVPQYAPVRFAGHESGEFFFVPSIN